MKSLCVVLCSLVCFVYCNGQNSNPLLKFGGQQNLIISGEAKAHDNVRGLMQDKAGNIWLGTTKQGIYRYDGRSFTNFTTKDGLSSNNIFCALQDKAGNIWFGTDAGVTRYNRKTFTNISVTNGGHFSLVNPAGNKASLKNTVICMLQDKSGKIWFGTGDAVYCYDGTSFTPFLQTAGLINNNKLNLNNVQCMLQDKKGNIWFSTWFEGLCRYDGKELVNFKPNKEVWYAGIYEDSKGNIWAGRRGKGVVRYDGKAFTNVAQGGFFDQCCVTAIIQDKAGNMWFGTEAADMTLRESAGGVWKYDGKTFKNFTEKDGLGNYSIFSLMQDKGGNIWAGTRNTGLYRYDGKTFTAFSE